MSIYQPYFYIIGWTEHDTWYQGIQYGQKAHPSNLWNTYFTSSRYVAEFRQEHGEPDVIETLPLGSAEEAIAEEIRYQRECDVLNDPRWLNKNINGGIVFDTEVRKRMSASKKGKPPNNKGKPHSQEARAKISAAQKGNPRSNEIRAKISQSLRSNSMKYEMNGMCKTLKEWEGHLGWISASLLDHRLRLGWSIERALTQLPRKSPSRDK